jgi:hypothetical protein
MVKKKDTFKLSAPLKLLTWETQFMIKFRLEMTFFYRFDADRDISKPGRRTF